MSFIPEEKGFFGKVLDKVTAAFVPPIDPKEAVRKWSRDIRTQGYQTDRSIREIEREKKKAEKSIKQHAKAGNIGAAKIVAKEVVNCNKAITRLYVQKANLMEMEMALKNQLAMVRVAGTLQQSSEVMGAMNNLLKAPEMQGAMRDMSKEMMKAGLIEEMIQDSMEDATGATDMEEDVEREVNKVMLEVAGEDLVDLPAAGMAKAEPTPEEQQAEMDLMAQLAAGQMPDQLPEQVKPLVNPLWQMRKGGMSAEFAHTEPQKPYHSVATTQPQPKALHTLFQ